MTVANISTFGTSCTVISTVTFPAGFSIKEDFPDDVEPVLVGNQTVRSVKMLMDGSLYSYIVAKHIPVDISVVAGSDSDINLRIVLDSSKIKQKLLPISDWVTLAVSYPDGEVATFIKGTILEGPPARSPGMGGRMKTNTYKFAFEDVATVGNSVLGSAVSIATTALKILG